MPDMDTTVPDNASAAEYVLSMVQNIRNNPQMDTAAKVDALNELSIERISFANPQQAERVITALNSIIDSDNEPAVRAGALSVMERMVAIEERTMENNNTRPPIDWQTMQIMLQNAKETVPTPASADNADVAPDANPQTPATASAPQQAQAQGPVRPGAPDQINQAGDTAEGDAAGDLAAAEMAIGYLEQNVQSNAQPGPQPGLVSTPQPTTDVPRQRERVANEAVDFAMDTSNPVPYNEASFGPMNGQSPTANSPVQASPGAIPVIHPGEPGPAAAQEVRPGETQGLIQLLSRYADNDRHNDVRDAAKRLITRLQAQNNRQPAPPPLPEPAPGSGTLAA